MRPTKTNIDELLLLELTLTNALHEKKKCAKALTDFDRWNFENFMLAEEIETKKSFSKRKNKQNVESQVLVD